MSAREHRIYFLLQRAAHRLKKLADRELQRGAGVTTAQAAVLNLVAEHPEISQRRLAALLEQNESAMTSMIARLLEAGLVTRTRDAADARAYTIGLTARGRSVGREARRAFRAINATLDISLGADRTASLAEDLRRLMTGIDLHDETPRPRSRR